MQAGSGDDVDGLAELQHDGLLGLRDREQRHVADDHDKQEPEQRDDTCNWRPHRLPPARLLAGRGAPLGRQFAERQIRHDALARLAAVIDELFRAAEHALHRLQINPFTRHVGRLLVFLVNLQEARALALGLGDRLLPVAFGGLHDLRRMSACLRHDLVGVGLRLVLQLLEIGARRLDVAEGVDHLRRRVDLLHLHLADLNAGAVAVQGLLDQFLHALFGDVARAGQDRLDLGAADHLAHRALGDRLHGALGILDVEEEIADAVGLDAPEHGEVDVDDVLVAGQHQALFRHVTNGAAAPRRIVDQRHADGDGGDAQCLWQQHGLDRIGQMIVQAGLHGADMLAEAQHDAELFGLHPEEARQQPERDDEQHDQRDADAGEIAARHDLLEAVLAAPQKVFQIRRPRPDRLRAVAPWSLRTRAPWATARFFHGIRRSPRQGEIGPRPALSGPAL